MENPIQNNLSGALLENKHSLSRTEVAALAAILGLYFFLGLFQLGGKSLWLDESFSIRDALSLTHFNKTHPLYFWILSVWMKLGQDEFTLRLLSVLFGALSVGLIYHLGRQLFGSRAGLIAAILLTLCIPHIFYSRQVRFYAPFFTLCLLQMIIFIQLTRKPAIKGFAAYLFTAAACLLVNPFGIFIWLAQNVYAIFNITKLKRFARQWFILQGLILLPGLAGFLWFQKYIAFWKNPWINYLPEVSLLDIPYELGRLMLFYYSGLAEFSAALPGWVEVMYVSCAAICAGLFLLISLLILRGRLRFEPTLVWLWLVVPVASMYILSVLGIRLWYHRYLYFMAAPWILLLAFGLSRVKRTWLVAVILSAYALLFAVLYVGYLEKPSHWGEDWRAVAGLLKEQDNEKSDLVLAPHSCYKYPLLYYYPEAEQDLEYLVVPRGRVLSSQDCHSLMQPLFEDKHSFRLVLIDTFFVDIQALTNYLELSQAHRIISKIELGSIVIYQLQGNMLTVSSSKSPILP